MPPIQDGIRTPGVYTGVNINTQRFGLPANEHKVLFITPDVQMSPPQVQMPINIYDSKSADLLFGENSVAGRMVAAAIKTNRFVDVQCLGSTFTGDDSNTGGDDDPEPHYPIACEGATSSAVIKNENYILQWEEAPTVDVYVNNSLVASNVNSAFINQSWYLDTALQDNASQLGYSVSGTSSNQEIFYNSSSSNITFSLVPKSDGIYGGQTYLAKDALKIDAGNTNPTAYKDPATGAISFCLAAGG